MKNFNNLGELIKFQYQNFNNKNFLNFKENQEWRSFSNEDFYEKIIALARGLEKLGLKRGQSLANYSYQNPIWLMVDLGAILAGAITVPIFNNISEDNLFYELKDSDAKFLFTDNEKICGKIKEKFPEIIIIGYGFKSTLSINFEDFLIFVVSQKLQCIVPRKANKCERISPKAILWKICELLFNSKKKRFVGS